MIVNRLYQLRYNKLCRHENGKLVGNYAKTDFEVNEIVFILQIKNMNNNEFLAKLLSLNGKIGWIFYSICYEEDEFISL